MDRCTLLDGSGHILREIGSAGDLDAETELILLENDIPTRKFSTAAMVWETSPVPFMETEG